jgi:predicted ATP pyrophosphatase (TIGR00289 family)
MGIPLYKVVTKGEKEEELKDLGKAVSKLRKKLEIDTLVSGAIESNYQKTRIDALCEEGGLNSLTPMWHRQPEELLKEMLDTGFEIVFTAVAAEGFTAEWLHRRLDYQALEDLITLNRKFGVHVSLEGGEGETFVKDAPFFRKKIEFIAFEKVWNRDSGYLVVKKARLKHKS